VSHVTYHTKTIVDLELCLRYRLGHGIVLAYIAIGWLSSFLFLILLKRENANRNAGLRDEVIEGVENKRGDPKNGRFSSVDDARREKGDEWSQFRYTY
jgi:hypothetical protein